jgi:hypothetical protein
MHATKAHKHATSTQAVTAICTPMSDNYLHTSDDRCLHTGDDLYLHTNDDNYLHVTAICTPMMTTICTQAMTAVCTQEMTSTCTQAISAICTQTMTTSDESYACVLHAHLFSCAFLSIEMYINNPRASRDVIPKEKKGKRASAYRWVCVDTYMNASMYVLH